MQREVMAVGDLMKLLLDKEPTRSEVPKCSNFNAETIKNHVKIYIRPFRSLFNFSELVNIGHIS